MDDDEALRLAEGAASWSQIKFAGVGRPSQGLAWQRMRKRVAYALAGNPRWTLLLSLWLDEVELAHPNADIMLDVYNPCDLMAALVHSGLNMEFSELVPKLDGGLDLAGCDGRLLHGCLVWNGQGAENAAELIRSIYPTQTHWALRRRSGAVWESDLHLLEVLGLKYALFEFPPDDVSGPSLLSEYDGQLVRTPATSALDRPGIRPFGDWLGLIDIEHLLVEYWSTMVPVNDGDQWLTLGLPVLPGEDRSSSG